MRRAALLLLALLPLVSCSGRSDERGFAFARRDVDPGTEVRGPGRLELPGSGWVELRRGARARVGRTPTLLDGDALVSSAAVRAGAAVVRIDGLARLRRSTGATVAVYRGRAALRALGRSLRVPALRQASVSDTGAVPRRPVPLAYDRRRPDPWDARELGDAIDLGDQLERRSRALDRALAPPAVSAAYLRSVLPATARLDPALVDRSRSIGETLVGASIALARPGSIDRRWRAAFAFRADGADWGLVALDQRASRAAVVAVLDGVLDREPVTPVRPRATTTTTTTAPPRSGPSPTTPPTAPPATPPPTLLPPPPQTPLIDLGPVVELLVGPTSP